MKIILVSGSPRPHGNTQYVLEACAEEIRSKGLEAEVLSLARKEIRACIACNKCKTGDRECILEDDSKPMFEKIATADGLIIGAPVYYGTARGDVMNFVQRLAVYSAQHGRFLDGMVGGPIAVGRRGGHTATLQEMLMYSYITGMIVPGANYWNMVFGYGPGEAQNDEEGLATAKLFAGRCAELVKKLKA